MYVEINVYRKVSEEKEIVRYQSYKVFTREIISLGLYFYILYIILAKNIIHKIYIIFKYIYFTYNIFNLNII